MTEYNTKNMHNFYSSSCISTSAIETVETKHKYRWVLNIDGLDPFCAKSVTRPEFYLLDDGNKQFEPLYIVMYDFAERGSERGSTTKQIWDWTEEKSDTGRNATLCMLDSEGNAIEKWVFCGLRPNWVYFGQLDYQSEDLCTISLTVDFDTVELEF